MTVSKGLQLSICFSGVGVVVVGFAMLQSKLPVPGRPTNGLELGKGLLRMQ